MTGTATSSAAGPSDWSEVGEDVLAAVAAKLEPRIRKAADDLYADLLDFTQDNLTDNVRFNIGSRLESAARETRNLRVENRALLGVIQGMLPLVKGGRPREGAAARDRWTSLAEAALAENGKVLRESLLSSVLLDALKSAEAFMAGFEGDELQEGVDERLAAIRAAIAQAEGQG